MSSFKSRVIIVGQNSGQAFLPGISSSVLNVAGASLTLQAKPNEPSKPIKARKTKIFGLI